MTGREMLLKDLIAHGHFADELRESEQKGVQKILQFLKNGHSLEEAEKQFSLQLQTSRQK